MGLSPELLSRIARIIYPRYKTGVQDIHDIFAIWPSISAMAEDLNEKHDTVFRWKLRRRIPEHVWPSVIEKAAKRERLVTAAQLLALNGPMGRRGRPSKEARA